MTDDEAKWTLTSETIGKDRLSVIVPSGAAHVARNAFSAHGVEPEVVESQQGQAPPDPRIEVSPHHQIVVKRRIP